MNLTMFPAPTPRFSGKIETTIGFNQGQLSYSEAARILDKINVTTEKCDVEANFGKEDEKVETLVFDYKKDIEAGSTLAYYLLQKGVNFRRVG